MGIVTDRRRRQRLRLLRGRMLCALVLALGGLSAASLMRGGGKDAAEALAGAAVDALSAVRSYVLLPREKAVSVELTLPPLRVYALQLGVFDDGQRAALEAARLQSAGVRCVVWQGERMRIVSGAALERDALDMESAGGQEAYILEEMLPAVALKIEAGERSAEAARRLLLLADSVFERLADKENQTELEEILPAVRQAGKQALDAHPENALYADLARSLIAWCDLVDGSAQEKTARRRAYAALTMCTICRELRAAFTRRGA